MTQLDVNGEGLGHIPSNPQGRLVWNVCFSLQCILLLFCKFFPHEPPLPVLFIIKCHLLHLNMRGTCTHLQELATGVPPNNNGRLRSATRICGLYIYGEPGAA